MGAEKTRTTVVMDGEALGRAVTRIAHEIAEKNAGSLDDLIIVGIRARGDVLAKRIQVALNRRIEKQVPFGVLDITLYRDDVGSRAALPRSTDIPFSINGKIVVLIDDVLYTGRSVRAAMDALVDFGRPQGIQLVVLIDRGHRELPIKPDYVGKNIPTQPQANVKVELEETDGRDIVVVEEAA